MLNDHQSRQVFIYPFCSLLCIFCAAGCATIHSPRTMVDPVPVYLAEYPVHSTILLPRDGKFVDYSFGDWNYAALEHKFFTDALGALVISGASEFELRIVAADPVSGEPVIPDHPDRVVRFYANRQDVRHRLKQLDERYQHDLELHRGDGMIVLPGGIVFVKDTEHYSWTHSCNHLTVQTLEALGYHVDGPVIGSKFQWAEPEQPPESQNVSATIRAPRSE